MIGVTGLTVKHSVSDASVELGTPLVADVNSPRQQYPPVDVSVAALERTGNTVAWSTFSVVPTCVPPLVQGA